MEWIVPALFVLATVAQWWLKRRLASKELPPVQSKETQKSNPPVPETDAVDDLGDLLEALGRRRHESPPTPVRTSAPAPMPPQSIQSQAGAPASHLPPLLPFSIQTTPPLPQVLNRKYSEVIQKKQSKHATPDFRAHLRDAVVMSEILAPPLALR